jgi:hypothetical protein
VSRVDGGVWQDYRTRIQHWLHFEPARLVQDEADAAAAEGAVSAALPSLWRSIWLGFHLSHACSCHATEDEGTLGQAHCTFLLRLADAYYELADGAPLPGEEQQQEAPRRRAKIALMQTLDRLRAAEAKLLREQGAAVAADDDGGGNDDGMDVEDGSTSAEVEQQQQRQPVAPDVASDVDLRKPVQRCVPAAVGHRDFAAAALDVQPGGWAGRAQRSNQPLGGAFPTGGAGRGWAGYTVMCAGRWR